MIEFSNNAAVALSLSVFYIGWLLLKPYIIRSPLDEVDGPPRVSLMAGNIPQMFGLYSWDWHWDLVRQYGRVVKLHGVFGAKWLYVSDPKALHNIILKDQHIFEEGPAFIATFKLVFGDGLLSTLGDHHRKQRKLLNPVFSINHMRDIIPIFYPITHKLRAVLTSELDKGSEEIDVLHWISRAALEYIGQAGIGHSFDDLTGEKETQSPYTTAAQDLTPALIRFSFLRQWLPFLIKFGPPRFRQFIVNRIPSKPVQALVGLVDTMHQTAETIYEAKKFAFVHGDKEMVHQVGQGKDILSVLMRANSLASENDRLPESEVIAQMNTLLFAGSDTTSSALARTLWLLADHPNVQEKLRKEVTEARQNFGDLMYDELTNLPYLDAVCRETLRLYAPISIVQRWAQEDAILPLSRPITSKSGKPLHEIAVPKGTFVMVSIANVNRDPSIWGLDAEEWRPERWLAPLPSSVDEAHLPGVYSNMLTFFGGGRACIGFKFSQLEMKVVLSVLLETFKFAPSGKEIIWTLPGIASPTTKGNENRTPHLPLKMTLVGS